LRKTKVRIVGDPELAARVLDVLDSALVFEGKPKSYDHPVGRDIDHSLSPGCTIYLTVKRVKEGAELEDTP